MEKKNKPTIDELLERKNLFEKSVKTPYFSKLLNCEIEIEDLGIEKLSDIINKEYESNITADLELIYAFCPLFRSVELHEKLNVKNPVDAVELLFGRNVFEIQSLAKAILKRYGYEIDKAEKIKK